MNLETLTAAVQDSRSWLDDFRLKTYKPAFQNYCRQFGPMFAEAAETEDLPALAGAFLDALEQGWKRRLPWNRGVAKAAEKQMLVVYLSPMLLEREEPRCRELCDLLRETWNSRWPKDIYYTAGFDKIQSGFRTAIMGIELRGFRKEEP